MSQRFFLFLLREESGGATWMTHPHAFLKKGGELMIDLKPYFAGYNKNPLFTIISDGVSNARQRVTEAISFMLRVKTGAIQYV